MMNARLTQFRPSILHILVFLFFLIMVVWYVSSTGDMKFLMYAIPSLILLLAIPVALTHMSRHEYDNLTPMYETEARTIRIREISEKMISKPVRIEGLVEEVRFKSLNRPHFIVADRTGVVPVKMFTSPREDIRKGDIVEVYGQVIRRYIVAGDPIINGVAIRKK